MLKLGQHYLSIYSSIHTCIHLELWVLLKKMLNQIQFSIDVSSITAVLNISRRNITLCTLKNININLNMWAKNISIEVLMLFLTWTPVSWDTPGVYTPHFWDNCYRLYSQTELFNLLAQLLIYSETLRPLVYDIFVPFMNWI